MAAIDPDTDPMPLASAVNLDSVATVAVSVLIERLGRLSGDRMRRVCDALAVATSCV